MNAGIEMLNEWGLSVAERHVVAQCSGNFNYIHDIGRDELPKILQVVGEDDAVADQIATQSYIHNNGFDKIVLDQTEGRHVVIRLHVWQHERGRASFESNIHSHRWPFCSILLSGHLHYSHYSPSPGGELLYRYKYLRTEGEAGVYGLEAAGRERLASVITATRGPDEVYAIDSSVIHHVAPPDRFTATLVIQGRAERDYTDVFSWRHNLAVPRVRAPRVTRAIIRDRVLRVLRAL